MLNGTCHLNHQRGFATLLTSLIILVGITLITLFTARTTLMEQRMSANHYRSSQAFYAAQAALEIGIGYINQYGINHLLDIDLLGIDFPPSSHPLKQEYPFKTGATLLLQSPTNPNNPTNCYQLIATGESDDQIGSRTISQCVTTLDISRGDGPEQPVISRLGVSLSGSAAVINRYGNTTIWSGDPVTLGNSTKLGTYIRDNNTALSADTTVLESTDSTDATQAISSSNLGIGFDIIDSDPALSGLTADDFFDNTFVLSRDQIKTLAQNAGQYFTDYDIADTDGLTGLIWIEGDSSLSGNKIIGTSTQPAIVIFNGDADITGTPTIYGLVYVRGQLKIAGTISVVGASVIEGDPTVNATGTINQVFAPSLLQNDNGPPLVGLTVAVAGTWKDWE
jgi:hypothetical protein